MNELPSFITAVIALSVAAERVVEVIKGMLPTFWLFAVNANPASEARRCAAIRFFSGIVGGVTAQVSGVNLLTYVHSSATATASNTTTASQILWHKVVAFTVAALLTSAGSAFWNHALDILKATKVNKEQVAILASGANTSTTKALA
jgi:hypothetical protein